jgi:hypothetical protein
MDRLHRDVHLGLRRCFLRVLRASVVDLSLAASEKSEFIATAFCHNRKVENRTAE